MEKVKTEFSVPVPHHVQHSPSTELPASLMNSRFVFVCEDASKPSIAPLYLVVEHRSKFFRLQIGTRIDYISVDLLKPVFLDSPVAPAAPPLRGRPPISPGWKPREPKSPLWNVPFPRKINL